KGLRQWDHVAARSLMEQERWEFERMDLTDARQEKAKANEAARKAEEQKAERQAQIQADNKRHKMMTQTLYDASYDLKDYNSFDELTKTYKAFLATKAESPKSEKVVENREKSRRIVQNRGEGKDPKIQAPTKEIPNFNGPQT